MCGGIRRARLSEGYLATLLQFKIDCPSACTAIFALAVLDSKPDGVKYDVVWKFGVTCF